MCQFTPMGHSTCYPPTPANNTQAQCKGLWYDPMGLNSNVTQNKLPPLKIDNSAVRKCDDGILYFAPQRTWLVWETNDKEMWWT